MIPDPIELGWQQDAACLGMNPELFFPGRGDTGTLNEAKRVCRECPVQEQCLEYSFRHHELWGVWGGTSERERRRLRRQRTLARVQRLGS